MSLLSALTPLFFFYRLSAAVAFDTRASVTAPPVATIHIPTLTSVVPYQGAYSINASFGCPPRSFQWTLDLSAGNGESTFVAGPEGAKYVSTRTTCSQFLGQDPCDQEDCNGFITYEYIDTITFSQGTKITNFSFEVGADEQPQASLGIRQVARSVCANTSSVSVGIFSVPVALRNTTHGEVALCGVNPDRYVGNIGWVHANGNALNVTSLKYGTTNLPLPRNSYADFELYPYDSDPLKLANVTFNAYIAAVGASLTSNGEYTITAAQYAKMQTLNFNFGGVTIPFPKYAQAYPRKVTYLWIFTYNIYVIILQPETYFNPALLGVSFLDRVYVVQDISNSRLGFASNHYLNYNYNS